jgi:hypothetical protein
MTWLIEVLEKNGIIPSANIADQVVAAIPCELLEQVLAESAEAVLAMRGLGDDAGDFARQLAAAGARSVLVALGDDEVAS